MSERVWLITWTTYGTWLPGDVRGFVGAHPDESGNRVEHNEPGTECDRDIEWLRDHSRRIQKQEAVLLASEHAGPLAEQLQETARYRRWQLLALAIMPNHVHLVVLVGDDPDPERLLHDFKSYGSRRLNRLFGSRTWWTASGSTRKLPNENAVRNAVRYVRDQPASLRIEVDPAWLPVLGEPCQ